MAAAVLPLARSHGGIYYGMAGGRPTSLGLLADKRAILGSAPTFVLVMITSVSRLAIAGMDIISPGDISIGTGGDFGTAEDVILASMGGRKEQGSSSSR